MLTTREVYPYRPIAKSLSFLAVLSFLQTKAKAIVSRYLSEYIESHHLESPFSHLANHA